MSAAQIRQRLEAILQFMQPHWEFVNCHMVNFITEKHWDQHVPAELRLEVKQQQQVDQCVDAVFWGNRQAADDSARFTEFSRFVAACEQHRLGNFAEVLTTLSELNHLHGKQGAVQHFSVKDFMSEKKSHEVDVTAKVVHNLIQKRLSNSPQSEVYVLDAGDGKGYLSSRLALQYGYNVIGIDSNISNTERALERCKRLQRCWDGLSKRAELQSQGITPPKRGKKHYRADEHATDKKEVAQFENYKTISRFVTSDLNILELLEELYPWSQAFSAHVLCLTGLHTCGNLAPTCIRLFHTKPQVGILCNIGCCYHLLKEQFIQEDYFENKAIMDLQSEPGFPMSRFLREKRVKIGRNARMLAAQSIDRTLAFKELPSISLYYRALLEVLCTRHLGMSDSVQVGKIRKFNSFEEYVALCCQKGKLPLDTMDSKIIEDLEKQYAADKSFLDLFYLLRMSFAPILESLILLDRLLYLKEQGYDHSYIVPLFDGVISPRHYGIVSIK